jgi:hypothetical protein
MDFTYLVPGFVALIVGVGGSVIFVIKRGHSFRLLLAWLIAVTVVIDFMLLVDWSRTDFMTATLLLTDLAFFTLYALIGALLALCQCWREERSTESFVPHKARNWTAKPAASLSGRPSLL